jgi:hypothetical protein
MFSFRSTRACERAERPAALRARNGDPACWQRQRNAPRCQSALLDAEPRVRALLLCAKHLYVAASGNGPKLLHRVKNLRPIGKCGEQLETAPYDAPSRPQSCAPRCRGQTARPSASLSRAFCPQPCSFQARPSQTQSAALLTVSPVGACNDLARDRCLRRRSRADFATLADNNDAETYCVRP